MLGSKIADGRTAEVYEWGTDRVIKLLRPGFDRRALDHEADIMVKLGDLRLQMPRFIEVIEVDGRPGLVFERVNGQPITVRPWNLRSTARLLGGLHSGLHRRRAAGVRARLPALVDRLIARIEQARLPAPIAFAAIDRLRDLPDGDRICHGDFHPGNILATKNGPLIIDWVDASSGHPAADVAGTVILARLAGRPAGLRGGVEELGRAIFTRNYLAAYPTPLPRRWLLPVAAARLGEDVPGERGRFLDLIDRLRWASDRTT